MRTIDADALKEDLTRFYTGEVTARALIDEQPTVGGWISVKDRLPPMEKCVLVFCKSKSEHVRSVRTITEMSDVNRFNYRCKTEPYWREPWDFFYANYDITHWMDLPEPPKEENDEHND